MPSSTEDDLFAPSLQSEPRPQYAHPWRLFSQLWVAFFGGALAVSVMAYLNCLRLNATQRTRRMILGVGLVAVLSTVLLDSYLEMSLGPETTLARLGVDRYASRGLALLAYLVLERLQRPSDRLYRFRRGEYESAWGPAIAAILILGAVQFLLARLALGLMTF